MDTRRQTAERMLRRAARRELEDALELTEAGREVLRREANADMPVNGVASRCKGLGQQLDAVITGLGEEIKDLGSGPPARGDVVRMPGVSDPEAEAVERAQRKAEGV